MAVITNNPDKTVARLETTLSLLYRNVLCDTKTDVMKTAANRALAIAHLLLISPALVFMGSLIVRQLHNESHTTQEIVMWYAGRMWTLWLLLVALPLSVLVTGCWSLLKRRMSLRSAQQTLRGIHMDWATPSTIVSTAASAIILTIVVLHMLAN